MKINIVIIYTFLLLLLQSIFGHTGFYLINIFAVVSGVFFILSDSNKLYLSWLLVFSIISDLILVQWLGMNLFANLVGVFGLLLVDRFFEVLGARRNYLSIILFLVFVQLTIYLLSIFTSGESLDLSVLLSSMIYSVSVGILMLAISKKFVKREVIIV